MDHDRLHFSTRVANVQRRCCRSYRCAEAVSTSPLQLFYQHNPYGTASANKSWRHAVSRDLTHWSDLGDVLLPDRLGAIYPGSAVVDRKNTSGFGKAGAVPMIAMYTSAGGHAPAKAPMLDLSSEGGTAFANVLNVRELKPALPAVAAR